MSGKLQQHQHSSLNTLRSQEVLAVAYRANGIKLPATHASALAGQDVRK
ncbi:MAG: hypothetical protein WAK92_00385 [Thiobacillus sp.]